MLKDKIKNTKVIKWNLAIFYLAQAGFVFKTSANKVIYIDPYLSDACNRISGVKRLIPAPINPEDVIADILICTHEHEDHLDPDAVPVIAKNPKVKFVGSPGCVKEFKKLGIQNSRIFLIEDGKTVNINGINISGVYADHGKYLKDAVGILLNIDGINIYHTGDTAYRPYKIIDSLRTKPDIIIPVINGTFGNLNSKEAAQLSNKVGAKITIGCHFGMFAIQNGDPDEFVKMCKKFAADIKVLIMKPAELYEYKVRKNGG